VEWPEIAAPELAPERIVARVRLEHAGRDLRRVEVAR
jgi:hypothetical protein